MNELRFCAGCR